MRHLFAFAALVAAPHLVWADAAKDELKKLQGVWKVVSIESEGGRVNPETVRIERMTIKDDTMGIDQHDAQHFTVNPTTKPKQLDTWKEDGKVETMCIYELDGDNLKLAFELVILGDVKAERPKSFDLKGNKTLLVILNREKKK